MKSLHRVTGVLLLALLFAAQAHAQTRVISASPVSQVWAWVAGLLQKSGCSLDPSGGNCPNSSSRLQDAGCSLDPDGCTKAGPKRDEGCSLDPSGCAPAVLNDEGCSLDPSGRCLK